MSMKKEQQRGVSHLFEAVVRGNAATVAALLASGTDPNEQDGPSGKRPLLAAVSKGRVDFVRDLLEAGADANATDRHGNGPLCEAVYRYSDDQKDTYVRIMGLLLDRGANPEQVNKHDVSPRSLAETIANTSVRQALEAALARRAGSRQ